MKKQWPICALLLFACSAGELGASSGVVEGMDQTYLIGRSVGTYYCVNDRWPNSISELRRFVATRAETELSRVDWTRFDGAELVPQPAGSLAIRYTNPEGGKVALNFPQPKCTGA